MHLLIGVIMWVAMTNPSVIVNRIFIELLMNTNNYINLKFIAHKLHVIP